MQADYDDLVAEIGTLSEQFQAAGARPDATYDPGGAWWMPDYDDSAGQAYDENQRALQTAGAAKARVALRLVGNYPDCFEPRLVAEAEDVLARLEDLAGTVQP